MAAALALLAASPALARLADGGPGSRLVPGDARWTLVDYDRHAVQRFRIPDQLPEIEQLQPERRDRLQALIRDHDLDIRFIREAIKATRGALAGGQLHARPEYQSRLGEIVIGIDRRAGESADPLAAHEPILKALPAYTRIVVLTPDAFLPGVRDRVRQLGLEGRTRLVPTPIAPDERAATSWVRDVFLLSEGQGRQMVFHPLSYRPRRDLAADDLKYLNALRSPKRNVVTAPLFYRAGNFLLGVSRRHTLFVGENEISDNATVFEHTAGRVPPAEEVLKVLAAITGADGVKVMPNTRHLFHVDMYMSFLEDGVAALLDPLDPEALPAEDLAVLQKARTTLQEMGYRIVAVPSVAARITHFQSSTNIVPFRHRDKDRPMALVPTFPDRAVQKDGETVSLNGLVEEAYRRAGITPIPVEDRFFPLEGNTHCVVVQLK